MMDEEGFQQVQYKKNLRINIFEEAVDNLRRHGFDPRMAIRADQTLEKQPAAETRNKPNLDKGRSTSDADVPPESCGKASEGLRSISGEFHVPSAEERRHNTEPRGSSANKGPARGKECDQEVGKTAALMTVDGEVETGKTELAGGDAGRCR